MFRLTMNSHVRFLTLAAAFAVCPPIVAAEPAPPALVPAELFAVPDEHLEVTVWARSPLLRNPTNLDIDKDGRVWVAEGVNYRRSSGRRPEGDRIVVIEDTDGDGVADKSWTFVQEKFLVAPLGVAVFDNQIVVSQTPDLIVYTDVNRNLRFDPGVDKREVLLTGFNGRNHDHSLHSVHAGPEGRWYFSAGNCGALFKDRSGRQFRVGGPYDFKPVTADAPKLFENTEIAGRKSDDGHVWIGGFAASVNPDGTRAEIIGHNFRNSYEQAVTSFGDMFQNDNDDPPACRVAYVMEGGNAGFASRDGQRSWQADRRPGQATPVAEWRQEDPGVMPAGDVYGGGSPTGVAFYENGALGEKWRGLLLTCEAGRNVVFGYQPTPQGGGFKLERMDFLTSNKERAFAGSDFLGGNNSVTRELKTFFRPSDVCVGPDGAVYVTDWFDPRVGGHADLDDAAQGAIYRIAPKGFKSQPEKVDYTTTAGQIRALKSPAVNVRHTGFVKLRAKGERVLSPVLTVLDEANPHVSARAIWLLAQLGPRGRAQVEQLLRSADDTRRLVAFRALRRAGENPARLADKMADDASPAVRREVALALRNVPLANSAAALLKVARKFDGQDAHYLEAIGLGAKGKEAALYDLFKNEIGNVTLGWTDAFSALAWRLGAPQSVGDLKTRALAASLKLEERKRMMTAIAFVPTQEAANAMVDLALDADFKFKSDALWWLFNRKDNEWKAFGLEAVMKARGLYDPDTVEVSPVVMPELPDAPSPYPPMAELLKLTGDAKRGEQMSVVCHTCHRVGAAGIEFGPDLTAFGRTQPREVILKSLIDPSAEIAHGYDGSEVRTKDGVIVHGIVVSNGDPVIITSMAGQTQTIPRKKIQHVRKLNRSLMFPAAMLGLDAQMLVDITAFLQTIPGR